MTEPKLYGGHTLAEIKERAESSHFIFATAWREIIRDLLAAVEECERTAKLLPSTFYSDRTLEQRVHFMVDEWRGAIRVNHKLEEECERIDKLLVAQTEVAGSACRLQEERDQLRAENERLWRERDEIETFKTITDLRAENERLRAALTRIYNNAHDPHGEARRALEEKV